MPSLSPLPLLANCVNRSFRRVEKAADWLVGKAGPFFIAICIALVAIGAWTFFTLLLPSVLTPASQIAFSLPTIASACLASYCLYIIYNIAWYYHAACTIPPGGVSSFVSAAADLAYAQASRQESDQDDTRASLHIGYLSDLDSYWTSYADRTRIASRWVSDAHDASIEGYLDHERNVRGKTEEDIEEEDLWPRVKMCLKCERVPLWWALACLPEELRDVEKQRRSRNGGLDEGINEEPKQQPLQDDRPPSTSSSSTLPWDKPAVQPLRQSILTWLPSSTADTLVPPPKPERAHHCSVCKTCIIKFDHHCPWLNQCVGLYNERYFVGFLVYMVFGTGTVLVVGWAKAWEAGRIWEPWPYRTAPRLFVLLTYILCFAMGLALLVMLASHLDMISRNLTSVESSDRQFYISRAKLRQKEREERKKTAVKAAGRSTAAAENAEEKKRLKEAQALEIERAWGNVYDLGTRRRNLSLFFNIGQGSSLNTSPLPSSSSSSPSSLPEPTAPNPRLTRSSRPRPAYYSLLPVRYPPHSDGWHWPKRRGTGGRTMLGVEREEEVEFSGGEEEEEGQSVQAEAAAVGEQSSRNGAQGKKKKKGKGVEAQRRDEEREVLAGRTFDGTKAGLEMQ